LLLGYFVPLNLPPLDLPFIFPYFGTVQPLTQLLGELIDCFQLWPGLKQQERSFLLEQSPFWFHFEQQIPAAREHFLARFPVNRRMYSQDKE